MLIGLLTSRAFPVTTSEATFHVSTGRRTSACRDCLDICHISETVSPGPECTTTACGMNPMNPASTVRVGSKRSRTVLVLSLIHI